MHWHVINQFLPTSKSHRFNNRTFASDLFHKYTLDIRKRDFQFEKITDESWKVRLDRDNPIWLKIYIIECNEGGCE